MSRPKPTIILSYTNPATYKSEQVLEAEAIFAVFYQGRPINMRSMNPRIDYPGAKYRKCAFSNKGHAFNLAERLNKMFKTNDFEVFKLTSGVKIVEKDETPHE